MRSGHYRRCRYPGLDPGPQRLRPCNCGVPGQVRDGGVNARSPQSKRNHLDMHVKILELIDEPKRTNEHSTFKKQARKGDQDKTLIP